MQKLKKSVYAEAAEELDNARQSAGVDIHPRGRIYGYLRGGQHVAGSTVYNNPFAWIVQRGRDWVIVFYNPRSAFPNCGDVEYWESEYASASDALLALAISFPTTKQASFADGVMRRQMGMFDDAA
jgi:hypothetical protein